VRSCPAVVDGKVYVGSYDGKVYCLNASAASMTPNEREIWNYPTCSPAVADGKVYVGSRDNKTYCLDASTGAKIWSYTTGSAVHSSPAVAGGKVYIGSLDGNIYAFGVHDVAITNVSPYKTIVGQGLSLKINVTAENPGGYTETFNVTLYANTTSIATQTITLTSGNSTTITLTWNTTGVPYGNYTITANATAVPGETDTTDNTRTCWVVVAIPGDAAVTNVVPSLIAGYPLPLWIIPINVTVLNNDTGTISFNVTAYYGSSTWTEIGTEPVDDLGEGVSMNVTFNWNISALTPCVSHNLKANVTLIGDVYAGNDEKVEGSVDIRIIGDVNGIGGASVADMVEVDIALGSQPGDPNYNPYADVDGNGSISVADMVQIDIHLGEEC